MLHHFREEIAAAGGPSPPRKRMTVAAFIRGGRPRWSVSTEPRRVAAAGPHRGAQPATFGKTRPAQQACSRGRPPPHGAVLTSLIESAEAGTASGHVIGAGVSLPLAASDAEGRSIVDSSGVRRTHLERGLEVTHQRRRTWKASSVEAAASWKGDRSECRGVQHDG